jgi:hypothetical protein
MLKKIIEPIIKCPNKCPCAEAIKKIYEDLKIKVIPLNIQKEEKKFSTQFNYRDRRDRCD